MNRPLPAPVSDIVMLVSRLILAVVMFAHGYQKLFIQGIGKTTDGFQAMNIPLAIVSASFVTAIEVAGSVLLLCGALTTIVCALYLVEFVGAATLVHLQNGLFVQQGGAEYVLVIIAFFVAIAAVGPGRYSVDAWMRARQEQYRAALTAATPAVSVTGSFEPVVEPAPPARAAAHVPGPAAPVRQAAPLSFAPAVSADAPMTDPRPFALPEPFAPEPRAAAPVFRAAAPVAPVPVAPLPVAPVPVTEAIPVALPRRSRPAHASR